MWEGSPLHSKHIIIFFTFLMLYVFTFSDMRLCLWSRYDRLTLALVTLFGDNLCFHAISVCLCGHLYARFMRKILEFVFDAGEP